MNKYFIYCRKSSEQEDRQILSLPAQEQELKELAKKQGLQIVGVYKESQTAHKIGRSDFNEMLNRIEAGEANSILVWDESRLARNSLDGGKIIYMIDLGQIVEIRKPSKIYTNTPDDKSWLAMCFMMSKKESDDKGVNVRRGLKAKAEQGWAPNSSTRVGYMWDKLAERGNKTILVDPLRFNLIRKAWDYMLTGTYTVPQILDLLNNEWGYRSAVHKSLGGKPMWRSKLYEIFTDPFYYGEFEYNGQHYKGKHQPMVTVDEFDKVQYLLGRNGRPRPKSHKFNYVGLMVCGECGASITCEEKVKSQKNGNVHFYIYYHCTKRKNPNCTQESIEEKELEKQIDEVLSRIQISERFKNWAIKYLNEVNNKEVDDRNVILKSIQKAYKDIVNRIDNLVKLKISPQNTDGSLLSDEEFKSQKQTLLKEKARLEEKMNDTGDRVTRWLELSEKTFDFATYARYRFANGTPEEKRQIFAGLGSNLVLKDKIVAVNLEKPLEFISNIKTQEDKIWQRLEPLKKTDNAIQIEDLWTNNTGMLRD